MPEMHQARYVTEPLDGAYFADTLYLPEHVAIVGDTVIVAKHLVFEGKKIAIGGPHSIGLFPLYPSEVLGKSLKQTLLDAGLPPLSKNEPPPSFDELIKALNLDPYRHGKRYQQVFEPGRIGVDVRGTPGAPGETGQTGSPGQIGEDGSPAVNTPPPVRPK